MPPSGVSTWYFRCSLAVWVTTPLLFTAAMVYTDALPYRLKDLKNHPLLYYPLRAIIYLVFSFAMIYIIIPLIDIFYAFKKLFCGDQETNDTAADMVPGFRLFENFGEAIPQFIIATVFYSQYHSELCCDWDFFLVSMSFSLGSILYGIVNGVVSRARCMSWFRPGDHENDLA